MLFRSPEIMETVQMYVNASVVPKHESAVEKQQVGVFSSTEAVLTKQVIHLVFGCLLGVPAHGKAQPIFSLIHIYY